MVSKVDVIKESLLFVNLKESDPFGRFEGCYSRSR